LPRIRDKLVPRSLIFNLLLRKKKGRLLVSKKGALSLLSRTNSIGMRRISRIRSQYLDNRFIKAINNLWAI
jgi:hypothetical protein